VGHHLDITTGFVCCGLGNPCAKHTTPVDWEHQCKKLVAENNELTKLILSLRKTISEQKKDLDDEKLNAQIVRGETEELIEELNERIIHYQQVCHH